MEEKIKLLLDKIDFDTNMYEYFKDAVLKKIIVSSKKSLWTIFIDNDNYIPIEVVKKLDKEVKKIDKNTKEFNIIYNIKNKDNTYLLNYYPYLLELLKKDLGVLEIYSDALKVENDKLVLVVSNKIEEEKLNNCLDKINNFYKRFSYEDDINIIIRKEENILEDIKKE